MTCQVVDCGLPRGHYNPLKQQLIEFHGRVVSCLDSLPEEGKWSELAKRVALVAVSPFLYLGFCIVYLAGMLTDMQWEKKHIVEFEMRQKDKIEWLPCPKIIKAFGGAEKVKALPVLEKLTNDPKEMSHPVMIHMQDGRPLFAFRVLVHNDEVEPGPYESKIYPGNKVMVIAWNPLKHMWIGSDDNPLLLMKHTIFKGTIEEDIMAEKIERLINGGSLGLMKRYPEMGLFVPEDKTFYRPDEKTSYLKGDDLTAYMKADTPYYEKEVIPGVREIILN